MFHKVSRLLSIGLLASTALAGLNYLSPKEARADTWACEVVLCLSNPAGWASVGQCVPPIKKLFRQLTKGKGFPRCSPAKGSGFSYTTYGYEKYEPCTDDRKLVKANPAMTVCNGLHLRRFQFDRTRTRIQHDKIIAEAVVLLKGQSMGVTCDHPRRYKARITLIPARTNFYVISGLTLTLPLSRRRLCEVGR